MSRGRLSGLQMPLRQPSEDPALPTPNEPTSNPIGASATVNQSHSGTLRAPEANITNTVSSARPPTKNKIIAARKMSGDRRRPVGLARGRWPAGSGDPLPARAGFDPAARLAARSAGSAAGAEWLVTRTQ